MKYVALREAGSDPDDLRLAIVRDVKRETIHAVVAAQLDGEWLILDNRMLIMINAAQARHYQPLYVFKPYAACASLSRPRAYRKSYDYDNVALYSLSFRGEAESEAKAESPKSVAPVCVMDSGRAAMLRPGMTSDLKPQRPVILLRSSRHYRVQPQ